MKLYIDPGTGSMLFTIIIGLATTGVFLFRGLWIKLKQRVSGGKVEINQDKIPLVIFSDHKRYWNLFQSICDELERRKIRSEFWTMSLDDPALEQNYEYIKVSYIGEGSKAFAKLNMMNAYICLATTPGLDVLQWKRSKKTDYYIHIYHSLGDCTAYRMFEMDRYDAVLMAGEIQKEPNRRLEQMRHLPPKELVMVGSPFMDVLKKRADDLLKDTEKQKNERITILCAPSWGESSILNKYGESIIDALISTGYDIIIRPHPQSFIIDKELMDRLQNKYPDSEHFEWNRDEDNFLILSKADLLVSDFSSVIFDYSLIFDRPIIYADTDFDTAPYDAAWLDEMPWTVRCIDTLGKKLSQEDFPNMKEVIDEVLQNDKYVEGRENARKITWAKQGESAKLVVDYLENKIQFMTNKALN